MRLARLVLAAGLLLAACLVYLQLLGPAAQPGKELRLSGLGYRERCAEAQTSCLMICAGELGYFVWRVAACDRSLV